MADQRGKAALTASERRDAFARLFAQHDRWLFAYLVSLLGSSATCGRSFSRGLRGAVARVRDV